MNALREVLEVLRHLVDDADDAQQLLVEDLALLATGRACVEVSLADRLRRLADLGDERLGRVALVDVLRPVDDDLRHADEVVAFVQRRRRELDVLFVAVAVDHRAGVAVAGLRRVAALDAVHLVGGLRRVEHLVGEGVGPPPVGVEQLRDVGVADRVLTLVPGERRDGLVPLGDVPLAIEDERRDAGGVEHLLEARGGEGLGAIDALRLRNGVLLALARGCARLRLGRVAGGVTRQSRIGGVTHDDPAVRDRSRVPVPTERASEQPSKSRHFYVGLSQAPA